MDGLPKVSIGIIGVVILQIGGFIWWTAQQASTISNLESTVFSFLHSQRCKIRSICSAIFSAIKTHPGADRYTGRSVRGYG